MARVGFCLSTVKDKAANDIPCFCPGAKINRDRDSAKAFTKFSKTGPRQFSSLSYFSQGPEGDDHPQTAIHSYIVWECRLWSRGEEWHIWFWTITFYDNIYLKISLDFYLLVDKNLENVCIKMKAYFRMTKNTNFRRSFLR